jgi:hypothetical protein
VRDNHRATRAILVALQGGALSKRRKGAGRLAKLRWRFGGVTGREQGAGVENMAECSEGELEA